ncbi:DUF2795 domain-containing protein [Methanobacterium sp.]|uniref:DUF2795 domain-containing protein n=1 Tax=Methanobacterium sp. TaxID=2164 RepID=UPI003C74C6E4
MAFGEVGTSLELVLKGVEYPASKQDLVQKAKDNNASNDLIQTIEKLPREKFNSSREVQEAYGAEMRGTG